MKARIAALVPAAGLSSRMGACKPLLPLAGTTVLGRAVAPLREAGIDPILVAAGRSSQAVCAEATRLGLACLVNADYERGMFSSILVGLRALPSDVDGVLLLPADIPLVRNATIKALVEHFNGERVLHPVFSGERGHPPLLPSHCLPFVLAWEERGGEGGLAGALDALERDRGADFLPVADANILFDVDTPADYAEAQHRARRLDRPSPEETAALLELHTVGERGLAHARAVARAALSMARALNAAPSRLGPPLDLDLIQAAALLHDIAKGLPGHEIEGGRILTAAGFPEAGRIVAAHRDIALAPDAPLTERELVYLGDKLVSGDRRVSVATRFQEKLDRFQDNPEAVAAIRGRRGRALDMLARVEAEAGGKAQDML